MAIVNRSSRALSTEQALCRGLGRLPVLLQTSALQAVSEKNGALMPDSWASVARSVSANLLSCSAISRRISCDFRQSFARLAEAFASSFVRCALILRISLRAALMRSCSSFGSFIV